MRGGGAAKVGVQMTMAASTASSARTMPSACSYTSGVADATRSTGLDTAAFGSTTARSASCVAADSSGTSSPAPSQASVARIPGPPELPTMATRCPRGSGWEPSTSAMSNSSSRVSTRMTPACRNRASTAMSGLAIAAVCDDAARTPAADRPLFTATIGLRRDTRRAMRANLRGLPNDSRYSSTTSVPGSSSQYWSRSLPLTSALLPTDTKLDTPRPMRADRSRMAMPSAPDCDCMAMRPRRGRIGREGGIEADRGVHDADDSSGRRAACRCGGPRRELGLSADRRPPLRTRRSAPPRPPRPSPRTGARRRSRPRRGRRRPPGRPRRGCRARSGTPSRWRRVRRQG